MEQTNTEQINSIQKEFILRAINDYLFLYDFENTTNKEFKECYGITKDNLRKEINKLKDVLK